MWLALIFGPLALLIALWYFLRPEPKLPPEEAWRESLEDDDFEDEDEPTEPEEDVLDEDDEDDAVPWGR